MKNEANDIEDLFVLLDRGSDKEPADLLERSGYRIVPVDLHRKSVDEAMTVFTRKYSECLRSGARVVLDLIHGQGGVTRTSKIRKKLRAYLHAHRVSVKYILGEQFDKNAGHTLVWPVSPLPVAVVSVKGPIPKEPKAVKDLLVELKREIRKDHMSEGRKDIQGR
jgi:hypothetical protein